MASPETGLRPCAQLLRDAVRAASSAARDGVDAVAAVSPPAHDFLRVQAFRTAGP